MTTTESPSVLAVEASGIAPVAVMKAETTTGCAMCGVEISKGGDCAPFSPGKTFTDQWSLATPGSLVVCPHCMAVWRREFMQKYSKAVICREGIYGFASMNDMAYWLLNPPEPPFLFLAGDQQMQHLIWRTPLSMSRDVYYVRHGEKLFTVRRRKLVEALDACSFLVAAMAEDEATSGKKKRGPSAERKHPFVLLARDIDRSGHGALRPEVRRIAMQEGKKAVAEAAALLNSLTPGEMWALVPLIYGQDPQKPEAKVSPTNPLA